MFDLVIACLADHVFSIRDAACKTLQQIVDIFGLDWAKASGLTNFALSPVLLRIFTKVIYSTHGLESPPFSHSKCSGRICSPKLVMDET